MNVRMKCFKKRNS